MLQRLVKPQRALHEVARVGNIGTEASLNMAQWDVMAQVQYVLKDTRDALSTVTVALGNVFPVIRLIRKKVRDFLDGHTLVTEVQDLLKRFQVKVRNQLEPLWRHITSVCDLRMKGCRALKKRCLRKRGAY